MPIKNLTLELEFPENIPDEDIKQFGTDVHELLEKYVRKDYRDCNVILNIDNGVMLHVNTPALGSLERTMMTVKTVIDKMYNFNYNSRRKDPNANKTENPNNPIKMDGEPDSFDGGAIRYTKKGKGRFDLIPGTSIMSLLWRAKYIFERENGSIEISRLNIMHAGSSTTLAAKICCIEDLVIMMCAYIWCDGEIIDENGRKYKKIPNIEVFMQGFSRMLSDVAKHYENGAEKYGVDNWKKGITVCGGDRGGSLIDSMLRHFNQWNAAYSGYFVNGDTLSTFVYDEKAPDTCVETNYELFDKVTRECHILKCPGAHVEKDEPHHVACVWNALCALWYRHNELGDMDFDETPDVGIIASTTGLCECCNDTDDENDDTKEPYDYDADMKEKILDIINRISDFNTYRTDNSFKLVYLKLFNSLSHIDVYLVNTLLSAYDDDIIGQKFISELNTYLNDIIKLYNTISFNKYSYSSKNNFSLDDIINREEISPRFNIAIYGALCADTVKIWHELENSFAANKDSKSCDRLRGRDAIGLLHKWMNKFNIDTK